MQRDILIHLVIVGKNPSNGEYAIGLKQEDKYFTIQGTSLNEPDIEACTLAEKYINAPIDWYGVRKRTFLVSDDKLHLIYTATIPQNIKLQDNVRWVPVEKLSSLEYSSEIEQDVIIEGMKI